MEIPGIKASHAVITENCRQTQGGDVEAFFVAMDRLKAEYEGLLLHWRMGTGAKFHIILSVEYPQKGKQ